MAARTLSSAGNDSKLIGVVVPQTEGEGRLMFQNQFYSEILGSIELCARQRGFHVLISATDANESYLTLAKERNLDGIIVIGMYPDEFYQQMKKSQIPIVLIDSYCNDHYYHNVRIDDAYGSYLATKYVLERGHRDIAFFCGRLKDNGVMKKRLAGYRDALAEFGLEFRAGLVFEGDIDYKDGIASANRLLDTHTQATAVVAAADILAIGAQKAFYGAACACRRTSPSWASTTWRSPSTHPRPHDRPAADIHQGREGRRAAYPQHRGARAHQAGADTARDAGGARPACARSKFS